MPGSRRVSMAPKGMDDALPPTPPLSRLVVATRGPPPLLLPPPALAGRDSLDGGDAVEPGTPDAGSMAVPASCTRGCGHCGEGKVENWRRG